MRKIILIILTVIATSFFFFPFVFTFFPIANTKMMLGALGVVMLLFNIAKGKMAKLNKSFLILTLLSLAVCFVSLLSMTINNTHDGSYSKYTISMWVWLSAAYVVINMIRGVHGRVSVELVCLYLIAVCVIQCTIAVTIDAFPIVKHFVDSFLEGEGFMGKMNNRMYGIGCALDVAGGRFSAILIMIAFLLPKVSQWDHSEKYLLFLIVSFLIISVIGNIIGRTTLLGMIIGLVYIIWALNFRPDMFNGKRRQYGLLIISITSAMTIVLVLLYNTDPHWRRMIQFGFEGFFSLAEKGRWEVSSNIQLLDSYVFPDNWKTWIIGDAFFESTLNEPFYTGTDYKDFYKTTDVGYLRFIFYFGITGLLAFSLFMIKVGQECINKFSTYRYLFACLTLLNFIIWFKVSTDIFLVFAPFLCMSTQDEEDGTK